MYYINIFFIYSILGHILEKVLHPDRTSGILYGYWTPVYGIGSLIIITVYKFLIKKHVSNKFLELLFSFLTGFILLTLIELIGGYLIEFIFGITFWDYSDKKYNIGKYASLEMGVIWGIASVVLIYIVQPILKKIIDKIPKLASYILIILFVIDIITTIILKA